PMKRVADAVGGAVGHIRCGNDFRQRPDRQNHGDKTAGSADGNCFLVAVHACLPRPPMLPREDCFGIRMERRSATAVKPGSYRKRRVCGMERFAVTALRGETCVARLVVPAE